MEKLIFAHLPHDSPPTPESPLRPTILPHVQESLSTLPITPPSPCAEATRQPPTSAAATSALLTGLHVLAAERDALTNLHHIYASCKTAQESFSHAATVISTAICRRAKLVVSGVGKSGKIGHKFVATCNSMQIQSTFLHPIEALHGDLGVIGPDDVLLFLTFSSNTSELHSLVSHLSPSLPFIVITAHPSPSTCPLFQDRPASSTNILLPAPIPVPEAIAFGVPAPTTSTTVALALCDALALSVAGMIHENPGAVFKRCHPGGAIGAAAKRTEDVKMEGAEDRVGI